MVNSLLLQDIDLEVLFVTGRPDRDNVRADTYRWLYDNNLGPDGLFMRPGFLANGKHDYRPDFIVKNEIYQNLIEPNYDILFAIDNRPQVLKMWQSVGVFTFAVGTPWIDF